MSSNQHTTWEQANIHSEKEDKRRLLLLQQPAEGCTQHTRPHNNSNTMSKLQNYKPHV
jgi:hypothetical protein